MDTKYPTVEVYRRRLPSEQVRNWRGEHVYYTSRTVWRWRFVATNGKTVADGSEGYHRRRWCLHGAEVALGLKGIEHLKPGESKVVRRSGGSVLVKVLGGDD